MTLAKTAACSGRLVQCKLRTKAPEQKKMLCAWAAQAVWRSTIGRNCRYYFSFRASVSSSRLGFAPRVLRLLHLRLLGIHLKYPHCGCYHIGVAQFHSTAQHSNSQLHV